MRVVLWEFLPGVCNNNAEGTQKHEKVFWMDLYRQNGVILLLLAMTTVPATNK